MSQAAIRAGVPEAIYHRRAVRSYTDQQPGETLILELIDAAVRAPTAMHLEPWAFVVIQDRAMLERYSERSKAMLLEPELAVGWGSAGSSHHDHPGVLADPGFNIFYDAGTLIVICRTADTRFAEADCWLAAENLMLAAAARGLGTCCIGYALPVLNARDVKHELGIPHAGAAVAPIILGTPRGTVPAVSRKVPEILRWVR